MLKEKSIATPIYAVSRGENNLFIKREDLFPYSFGGNKARKGVNFFKDIKKTHSDCVVTYGSSSSNHCRVIANMAARNKMDCYIICPEEESTPTFNSDIVRLLGAKCEIVPVEKVSGAINARILKLRNQGKNPYFIAGGGHGDIGTQSYVECYQEIAEFETINDIDFDYIFLATGTGTTQAGLVCGSILRGGCEHIVGISIARPNPRCNNVIRDSVEGYFRSIGESAVESEISRRLDVVDDYTGAGYGRYDPKIKEVSRRVFREFGIPLDNTYTAKAFYGMESEIKKRNIKGKNILFIHTGGTPLFFDDIKGD